ncbi:hypothetical protein [Mesorhizobium japonicum]|nr:hypothetical protein [Mesorhizobium japonicum]
MQDEPGGGQFGNDFSMLSPKPGNFCSQGLQPAKGWEKIARQTMTANAA